jgi:hypothetical protein
VAQPEGEPCRAGGGAGPQRLAITLRESVIALCIPADQMSSDGLALEVIELQPASRLAAA